MNVEDCVGAVLIAVLGTLVVAWACLGRPSLRGGWRCLLGLHHWWAVPGWWSAKRCLRCGRIVEDVPDELDLD